MVAVVLVVLDVDDVPVMPVAPVMPVIPVIPIAPVSVVDIVLVPVSVDIVVVAPVSVAEVVIDVSVPAVSAAGSSFLHAVGNSTRAAMVRRTRIDFFIMSPLDELFSVKLIDSVVVASGLPALTSLPLDVFPTGKKTVGLFGGGGVP